MTIFDWILLVIGGFGFFPAFITKVYYAVRYPYVEIKYTPMFFAYFAMLLFLAYRVWG